MKQKFYMSMVACVLLMASCSQEDLAEKSLGEGLAKASTSSFECFEEDGETRSIVDPSGSTVAFKWQEGDKLAIYSGAGASGMTNYDLIGVDANNVGTFQANGFLLTTGAEYYAFTPYDGTQTKKTQVKVDYDDLVQKSNGAFDHLGAKDFQYSDATVALTDDPSNLTHFNLKHLGAVCRFRLKVSETANYKQFRITGTGLVTGGKLNLTTGSFTPEATGSITMKLGGGTGSIKVNANEEITLYVMLPQQDLGTCVDLAVELYGTETVHNHDKMYIAYLNGKDIKGGKAYGWKANLKEYEPVSTVGEGKRVKFTKGNLWWDGSNYHFESNQTDYPNMLSTSHIGYFWWTSLKDYKSGNPDYMPYALNFSNSGYASDDKFFCCEENPLTVDGVDGYYALSDAEWEYITKTRARASQLYKYGVTVGDKVNCLVIAHDRFYGTLKSSYTLEELNANGLTCLPAAGERSGYSFKDTEGWGLYWLSTVYDDGEKTWGVYFNNKQVYKNYALREYPRTIRLVKKDN